MNKSRFIIAVVLVAALSAAAHRAHAFGFDSGSFGWIFRPSTTVILSSCAMTGIADLSNTCNDIYLLTGGL